MRKNYFGFIVLSLFCSTAVAQTTYTDTIAWQDFEVTPATPTWNFTGPVIYNSGTTTATAAPPSSPIGIGGSRAWETTTNSGGLVLDFANTTIPAGYDSIRVHFNLAAMCLTATSGGPDDLDYVLVAYSLDNGMTYTNRLRIRGGLGNNTFWAYSATGVGKVNYLPATEALFQPTGTGLQTTEGYSNCEIVFPGSVTQLALRITCRSSSSTDTWLVDNLTLTGEYQSSVGITETGSENFLLYPNPAEEFISLQFENTDLRTIEIITIAGQIISSKRSNEMLTTVALPENKGVYFVRVCSSNGIRTERVVK